MDPVPDTHVRDTVAASSISADPDTAHSIGCNPRLRRWCDICADAAAPAAGSSPKRQRKASPKAAAASASLDAGGAAAAAARDSDLSDAEEAGDGAGPSSPEKARKKPVKKAVLKNTGLESKVGLWSFW